MLLNLLASGCCRALAVAELWLLQGCVHLILDVEGSLLLQELLQGS
jgi:hypothetical protein